MANIMNEKNIVIAGNTLEEVKADLAALEVLMRSGMTSGCGGQTELAALEGHAAMLEVKGRTPACVMVALTPQMPAAFSEEKGWDEEEEEDWDEEEEEDWDEDFRRDFGNEAEEMVEMVLGAVESLEEPEVLASDLVLCATDLLRAAIDYSVDEISRGEMLECMLNSAEVLRQNFGSAV